MVSLGGLQKLVGQSTGIKGREYINFEVSDARDSPGLVSSPLGPCHAPLLIPILAEVWANKTRRRWVVD